MGLFSRGEGLSKSEDTKPTNVASGWFSRANAEPSRQALAQLMKDYAANQPIEVVDKPPPPSARSRLNTAHSASSSGAKTLSSAHSNPRSRPSTRQQQSCPSASRPQTSSGGLLSKGSRILKRAGSKATIRPQTSHAQTNSEPDVPRCSMSGALPLNSAQPFPHARSSRPGRAATLGGPSDVRHIDQIVMSDVEDFKPITKAELEAKIEALALKRKHVDAAPVLTSDVITPPTKPTDSSTADTPKPLQALTVISSPTSEVLVTDYLGLPSPAGNRVSRFSWAPNYMLFSDVDFMKDGRESVREQQSSPKHGDQAIGKDHVSAEPNVPLDFPCDILAMPPPGPQSTTPIESDGTVPAFSKISMESITAPTVVQDPYEDAGASSRSDYDPDLESVFDVQSIRLSRAFPMPQSYKFQDSADDNVVFGNIRLSSIPNMFTTSTPPSPKKNKRFSIGFRDSDMCDWEEAIDYSWEHADDFDDDLLRPEDDGVLILQRPEVSRHSIECELAMDPSSSESGSSMTSTPQLVHSFASSIEDNNHSDNVVSSALLQLSSTSPKETEQTSPLQGLGLASFEPRIPVRRPHVPFSTAVGDHHRRPSEIKIDCQTVHEEPSTPLSRSSSRNSILFSLASSTLVTQRSSQSSAHSTEFATSLPRGDQCLTEDHWRRGSEGQASCVSTDYRRAAVTDKSGPCHSDAASVHSARSTRTSHTHRSTDSVNRPPVPSRCSSISAVPVLAVATAIPALTAKPSLTDMKARRANVRASYSLFPSAAPLPPIPTARLSRMPTIVQ